MRSISQPTRNFNPKHLQTPAMPVVNILAIRPKKHSGPVRAEIDLEYGGVAFYSLQIMADADALPWINWPMQRRRDGNYAHICRPVKMDTKRLIESVAINAWREVAK